MERLSAVLNITVDVPGPAVSLGRVELTAVAGTARLHTNKEVCTLYTYFFTWKLYICIVASDGRDLQYFWLGATWVSVCHCRSSAVVRKVHLVVSDCIKSLDK